MRAKAKLTIAELRELGFQVRVSHHRLIEGTQSDTDAASEEFVAEKLLNSDYFKDLAAPLISQWGGFTRAAIEARNGEGYQGRARCNSSCQAFHRSRGSRIASGRAYSLYLKDLCNE